MPTKSAAISAESPFLPYSAFSVSPVLSPSACG